MFYPVQVPSLLQEANAVDAPSSCLFPTVLCIPFSRSATSLPETSAE